MQCNYTEGGQRNCSEHADLIVPCDIYAPTGETVVHTALEWRLNSSETSEICTPTISSTLIDRIIVNTPFFGIVFYYAQWAFLVVFVLGFVVALFRRPRDNVDMESADAEAEEDEQRGLLEGHRRHGQYGGNSNNNNHSWYMQSACNSAMNQQVTRKWRKQERCLWR